MVKTVIERRWMFFYCLSRAMGRTHEQAFHEAWSYLAKILRKQSLLMDGMTDSIGRI